LRARGKSPEASRARRRRSSCNLSFSAHVRMSPVYADSG
jgi:hypothetical protein